MSHVLARDVDRHLDVELEFDHFEGCGMPMSKKVPDESPISSCGFSPISIRNTRRLNDRRVQILSRHVVNEAHKSVIQDIPLHFIIDYPFISLINSSIFL
jgi:hypothetical protein